MERDDGGRPYDEVSSNSLAGSAERIELYRKRWAAGKAIFSPYDSKDIESEVKQNGQRLRIEYVPGIRVIRMES